MDQSLANAEAENRNLLQSLANAKAENRNLRIEIQSLRQKTPTVSMSIPASPALGLRLRVPAMNVLCLDTA